MAKVNVGRFPGKPPHAIMNAASSELCCVHDMYNYMTIVTINFDESLHIIINTDTAI